MTTYVLVHGAWHGSWVWKRVRRALREAGHDVFTPTLTGLCERSHLLAPDIDLETHIADVVNLLRWEELSDVVLVGHSYGGCVITGAADRVPERLRALVYVDAFVLEDGESLYGVLPEAQVAAQVEAALRAGDGWKVPPRPAATLNVNAADRDWVDRQRTLHPLATMRQALRLTRAAGWPGPATYVRATDFPNSPFPPFYERARQKGWRTVDVAAGHDVMLDAPAALTHILLEAAADSDR